jgi:hypothetical protein
LDILHALFGSEQTSINACETDRQDLPDDYYLTNITRPKSTKGRLQSWPGAWRLDLTNSAVQQWQAQLMYNLVAIGGPEGRPDNATGQVPLTYDGLFVDNVFMDDGSGANSQDIFHNKFTPVDRVTGKAMVDFDEKWRSGMVNELEGFRKLMPNAFLHGHAMNIDDANITANFNAISIGFTTPEIVEGRQSFAAGFKFYDDWMTKPEREPHITSVESAVRFQIGYGYGFGNNLTIQVSRNCTNSNSVPSAAPPAIGDACSLPPKGGTKPGFLSPETYLFSRSEYQFMRFGLGYTLMKDGYYTHELGDSWHGMDWDYDELHFNLGLATGNGSVVATGGPHAPLLPAIPLAPATWSLFVDLRTPPPGNGTLSKDAENKPTAQSPASIRVDVVKTPPNEDGIDLQQNSLPFSAGGYELSFWAKASADKTPVYLNTRKDASPWSGYGLAQQLHLTDTWTQYNVSFTCTVNTSADGRLSFYFGRVAGGTTVWINSPTLIGALEVPPVMRRDFECGIALLNGDTVPQTVVLESGLQRLVSCICTTTRALLTRSGTFLTHGSGSQTGAQAPLEQYFVDDNSSAFHPTGEWTWGNYNSGYHGGGGEEVRPKDGFYHHWEKGAHSADRIPTSMIFFTASVLLLF